MKTKSVLSTILMATVYVMATGVTVEAKKPQKAAVEQRCICPPATEEEKDYSRLEAELKPSDFPDVKDWLKFRGRVLTLADNYRQYRNCEIRRCAIEFAIMHMSDVPGNGSQADIKKDFDRIATFLAKRYSALKQCYIR